MTLENSAPAAPVAAPAPVNTPAEAPAAAPQVPQNAREALLARREARRQDPNHDQKVWERAGAKVRAKEAAAGPNAGTSTESVDKTSQAAVEADAPAPSDADLTTASPDVGAGEAPPPADRATALAALQKQAEALGLKFDGKGVTVADRYAFREEKRNLVAKLQAKEAELAKAYQAKEQEIGGKGAKYTAFETAFANGDPNAMAEALGIKGDPSKGAEGEPWNILQAQLLERVADPHYREIQELKASLQAEKEEKAKAEKAEQERRAHMQRAQAIQNIKSGIAAEAKSAKEPLLSVLSDDPMFVDTLYALQAKNYDEVTQTTVSLEEALDEPLPNGRTLREEMRGQYERLAKVFGQAPAPAPKPTPAPAKAPKAEATVSKHAPAPKAAAAPVVKDPSTGRFQKRTDRREETDERIRRFTEVLTPRG